MTPLKPQVVKLIWGSEMVFVDVDERYRELIEKSPLLLKVIDARATLSVQVHPDDKYARTKTPNANGKDEAWYVLSAEPHGKIYYGFSDGVTEASFRAAMNDGKVEPCLRALTVKSGDILMVPSGTVHALGAGVQVVEIQQNSYITYRIFDWGRVEQNGQPREMHLQDGFAVMNFGAQPPMKWLPQTLPNAACNYQRVNNTGDKFTFDILSKFTDVIRGETKNKYQIIYVLDGAIEIATPKMKAKVSASEAYLIAPTTGEYTLTATNESKILLFSEK